MRTLYFSPRPVTENICGSGCAFHSAESSHLLERVLTGQGGVGGVGAGVGGALDQ